MSRIAIPSLESSTASSRPSLDAVNRQLGLVPNMFRLIGLSTAALQGYLGLSAALAKGSLGAQTSERIALAVAEANGCGYCLSAHSYLAKNVAKLDDAEITANRDGRSNNAKADAAVHFATQVVAARGHVTGADVATVKAAGFTDAEIIEIVVAVALNTLTNYVNEVAQTDIDFPIVEARKAA